jgi:hypothetical protein
MRACLVRVAEHPVLSLVGVRHDIFTKRIFSESATMQIGCFSFQRIHAHDFYAFNSYSQRIELLCFVTDHNSSHKCRPHALCWSQSLRVARINRAATEGLLLSSDP